MPKKKRNLAKTLPKIDVEFTTVNQPHRGKAVRVESGTRGGSIEHSSLAPKRGTLEFLEFVNHGVPTESVIELAEELEVSKADISSLIGMTYKTFNRRIASGDVLDPDASERALYIQSIHDELESYFKDEAKATRWLKKPREVFGNRTPLELLKTHTGLDIVSNAINGMKHGFGA